MSVPGIPEQLELFRFHVLRMQTHWGEGIDMKLFAWPKTPKEWRQTGHGAPWDTNVEMAMFYKRLCQRAADEGMVVL